MKIAPWPVSFGALCTTLDAVCKHQLDSNGQREDCIIARWTLVRRSYVLDKNKIKVVAVTLMDAGKKLLQ